MTSGPTGGPATDGLDTDPFDTGQTSEFGNSGDSGAMDESDSLEPSCGGQVCDVNARCIDDVCVCDSGYEGDGSSCEDANGCVGTPCPTGIECIDVPAPGEGFTCGDCPPGTRSDGSLCADIDGCADDPCFPDVACEDVPAPGEGFTCGDCPAGTEGDGVDCADIDRCAAGPCFPGVDCEDVPAPGDGFSCGTCPAETYGDGVDCVAAELYELGDQSSSSALGPFFRANGYMAYQDGWLGSFEVYLQLTSACELDFYVFEAASAVGALTLLWHNTVQAGAGATYRASGPIDIPITDGTYYALGVGWNCTATYYWNNGNAYPNFPAGVGMFTNTRWDNGYPGASDVYTPPNTGSSTATYDQRIYFAPQ